MRSTNQSACGAQVAEEDLQRVAQATGAAVQTTVNGLDPRVLGSCRHFEEVQVRRTCAGASCCGSGCALCQQVGPRAPVGDEGYCRNAAVGGVQ